MRPSAANGEMVTVVTKIFTGEESCVPSEAEDRLIVEAFLPIRRRQCRVCRVGRTFAVSAVIAVSVATSVQCVQNDTVVSERKRKSSNKRCTNFVVKDSVIEHRKTMGLEIELGRACGVSTRVEDALVLYTSGQAQKKNGDAKIQARPTMTPLGTKRKPEHSG